GRTFHTARGLARIIVIFDLGGGAFYVSVLGFKGGKSDVKVVRGDMHLGGEDFNKRMVEHCIKLFKRKYKVDASKSAKALWRLYSECERAKRILSSATKIVIAIDSLFQGKDFHARIKRAKFEELNADLFEKCMKILE
ncbi:hypothetical protein KI387_023006, partial [Taxus chinensis]